ncbi:peptide/nickel transport system substrate-binding protein [Stella humosa]|uniref:Peptide/nickel transport system substrate-binding protein n=1 Tax=Stella humosa TaxID=94 RepID=A0A3N1KP87_9PROT|nr:ABC transporter substrate-binding protein [Stella humosa]ROP83543.1 peptide/nickel transport system substrate-binding protein [Stella humosa]BBK33184.1 ABC transporter substrate-binding protein [Stella humosa]
MKRLITLAFAASMLAGPMLAGHAGAQTTLRIGLAEDPDVMDPTTARTFVGRIVFSSICDKLLDIDKDQKLIPQLATEWAWSDDQKQLTMKLRPNVKFHDGEPMDAAAVKYSLERHLNFPGSRRKGEISQITAITVVDPLTVRIDLSVPFAPLLAQFTDRAGMIMSPKAAQAMGDKFGSAPVCAGPYKWVERVQQDRIVVERFADYWDKANIHFDRIVYQPVIDATVRLANLQSGQLDLVERVAATDVEAVKKNNRLRLVQATELGYLGLSFNIANGDRAKTPLGQDPRVRRAIELAIDRDILNQVAFEGLFKAGNQWVSPESPWYVKSMPAPKRDVTRAKQLLKEAGVPNLSFTANLPSGSENAQVAQIIQAMLQEAGIDMKLRTVEFATSLQMAAKGDFEAYFIGWSGRVDPDGNIWTFNSCEAAQNDGRYCNPEMDRWLKEARSTNDRERRMAAYEQAMKIHQADMPRVYLYHRTWFYGLSTKLQGFQAPPDGLVRVQGLKAG